MSKLLYVDACVRAESRTRRLGDALVERLAAGGSGAIATIPEIVDESSTETAVSAPADRDTIGVDRLRLSDLALTPLDEATLAMRDAATASGDFSDSYFDAARQFMAADTIVIAAPYYDLSFPASVKLYIERLCINGLTFRYGENGAPQGLCRASMLYYVTTAGGEIGDLNMGYDYVKTVTRGLLGVSGSQCIRAVGLDIIGNDADSIMASAIAGITSP